MRIFFSKLTYNVFVISAIVAGVLLLTSLLFPNPLWPNCSIYGCEFGRGWPIPTYYSVYCTTDDSGCSIPYVNIAAVVFNLGAYFFLAAFAITSVSKEEYIEPTNHLGIEKR